MSQVVALRESPAGSDGLDEQAVTVPPPRVGVWVEIAKFWVVTRAAGLKLIVGAISLMVMSRVEAKVPPVLDAVIVWVVCVANTEAVPDTAQVEVLRLSPVGSAGVTEQPVIAPPVELGVWVASAEFLVPTTDAGLNARIGA